jgi:hypothetical protein
MSSDLVQKNQDLRVLGGVVAWSLAASLRAGSASQPSTRTIPERKELNERESVE